MRILLILLGVLWIITGVLLFVLTDPTREFFRTLLKKKNIKIYSILPLIVGLVLILGAQLVSMPWVAVILGIASLSKGLFFMFGPKKKIDGLIDWWLNAAPPVFKSWGIVTFLLGVMLLLLL